MGKQNPPNRKEVKKMIIPVGFDFVGAKNADKLFKDGHTYFIDMERKRIIMPKRLLDMRNTELSAGRLYRAAQERYPDYRVIVR